MLRTFLHSKIHRATVTEADLNYLGSLSIDREILTLAGLEENEVIHVANLTNGERLTTYAIAAPHGSRTFGANGAAAHKLRVGDRIIIFGFAQCTVEEFRSLQPTLVFLDDNNDPIPGPARESHADVMPAPL
ncbi:MAG TPA: aspartate 1-decarboxylase [Gemmatimonadaceae bacterium]|nr:aspartate 1-decarboxylase [Gemmatimonadaceae bacterium]